MMPFRDRKSFSCDSNAAAVALLQDSLHYELASIPTTYSKVLIGHFALEGSIPVGDEIDDIANELFCPLTMFKGYDYVWMGHVHKPQVMSKSPYIAHIGSMDVSNFGESEQSKIIVIFDTEDLSFKEVKLPTRPLTKIVIAVPKDTADTTQFVLDLLEKEKYIFDKAIVRLEISLLSPDLSSVDRSKIEKFIYKKGVFNISGFSESKKLALIIKDEADISIDTTLDAGSAIKKWADKRYPDELDGLKKNKFMEISLSLLAQLKNESKE
jgi:exonuclease SbcD